MGIVKLRGDWLNRHSESSTAPEHSYTPVAGMRVTDSIRRCTAATM